MKKTVAIVGLGLIGGSMSIDLKRRGFAERIIGVENDPVNASAAEKIGLADEIMPLEDAVSAADIVVVAVPVGAAVKMLPLILDNFNKAGAKDKIVIDTCSTKARWCAPCITILAGLNTWLRTLWQEPNTRARGRQCRTFLTDVPAFSRTVRSRIRKR